MSVPSLQPSASINESPAPAVALASRRVRRISLLASCFLVAALALAFRVALTPAPLWTARTDFPDQVLDDAYMYIRYADHILGGQGVRWNVGGPPTFGATSLGYLAWVTVVRALTPGDPFRTIMHASMVPGLLVGFALILLATRSALPTAALPWGLACGWLFLLQSPLINHIILIHAFTGMETTFSVLVLAVILLIHDAARRSTNAPVLVLAGLTPVMAYLARPDLLPFPLGVLLLSVFLSREPAQRRRAVRALGGSLIALALLAAGCWLYFGTPVPLSFFAKSAGVYGDGVRAAYATAAVDDLYAFVQRYALLFIPAAIYSGHLLRWARRQPEALDLGVLCGCVVFLAYHLGFVVPIMHYYERFYTPMLPAVAWLAFRGVQKLVEGISRPWTLETRKHAAQWVVCVAAVGLGWAVLPIDLIRRALPIPLAPEGLNLADSLRIASVGRAEDDLRRYDVLRNYRVKWANYWYRLDEFSIFPDNVVIATTEVGHVAALNPNKRIIDLSGLNDARFIFHGWDMDAMLRTDHPDVIYLPHPDYEKIRDALRTCSRFHEEYDVFEPSALGGARFGVALRRSSPYAKPLTYIIRHP